MSLDEELRTTLGLEAGARSVPPPDVLGLIRGGRIRRRRRTVARLGAVAVAALVVGAIGLGVATEPRADPEPASRPGRTVATEGIPRSISDRVVLPPDTYRAYVGDNAAGGAITADFTLDGPYWQGGDFAVLTDQYGRSAGFGVYQPEGLAASGTGCAGEPMVAAPRTSPQALARRLARLPRSTVLQAPTGTEAFGFPAEHLRLQIDVDCPTYYLVANGRNGSRGITYTANVTAENVIIDFWVLDLGGALVVVDEWHNLDAPSDVVDRAGAARRSITFIAGG